MAEFIMKDMVSRSGMAKQFVIASCATSSEEIFAGVGNPVYPRARAVLARHGLSCEGKRATLLRRDDYDKYDAFLCMDSANVASTLRIFSADPQNKVGRLLDRDISDPWYTGRFDAAYRDIYAGCESLFERLKQQ